MQQRQLLARLALLDQGPTRPQPTKPRLGVDHAERVVLADIYQALLRYALFSPLSC